MKRTIVALFAAAILAGCASTSSPHGNAQDISQAKEYAFSCTRLGVRKLDDHVSSARVIGAKIARACRSEWMQYTKLSRPIGKRTSYMVGWYYRMENQQRAWATQAVLLERSRQASR